MARAAPSLAPRPRTRLGAVDWIEAARAALIAGGIAAVKVEPLAAALGVTVGSFYWHFRDRAALLAALQEHWQAANSAAFEKAAASPGTAEARFEAFMTVWIREEGYSPAYDSAMRDWARTSEPVRDAVQAVDTQRIFLLRSIYADLGYDADRAEVRARITYFHQVGYYALGLTDDEATRLRLRPLYLEALRDGRGRDMS